jgi:hypothetical protein
MWLTGDIIGISFVTTNLEQNLLNLANLLISRASKLTGNITIAE